MGHAENGALEHQTVVLKRTRGVLIETFHSREISYQSFNTHSLSLSHTHRATMHHMARDGAATPTKSLILHTSHSFGARVG